MVHSHVLKYYEQSYMLEIKSCWSEHFFIPLAVISIFNDNEMQHFVSIDPTWAGA